MKWTLSACLAALVASAAYAHEGVKNPAVMARMHAMKTIGADVKVLGDMAKGSTAFDASAARVALERIAMHAADTPGLFEAPEDDPKSEALPVIWERFDDFRTKAGELEQIAAEGAATLSAPEDVPPLLQALGANCKSCHSVYRE